MGVPSSALLRFFFLLLAAGCAPVSCDDGSLSFSFETFAGAEAKNLALYGDASVVNSTVRIARRRRGGRVMYRGSLDFGRSPSYFTRFSFSISAAGGGGVSFLAAPSSLRQRLSAATPGVFSVEFVSPDLVRVGLGGGTTTPGRSANISESGVALARGEKMQAWIDYGGESRTLEVRLGKHGRPRPPEAVLSYPVDLSGLIWKSAISVGIAGFSSSSSAAGGNFPQMSAVLYSWTFRLNRAAAYRMHSDPLRTSERPLPSDPPAKRAPPAALSMPGNSSYLPGLLNGLLLGAAGGATVAFVAFFFACTAITERRHRVAPPCGRESGEKDPLEAATPEKTAI